MREWNAWNDDRTTTEFVEMEFGSGNLFEGMVNGSNSHSIPFIPFNGWRKYLRHLPSLKCST